MTDDKPYLIITWKTMKTIVVVAIIVFIIFAVMTSLSVAVLGRNDFDAARNSLSRISCSA